MTIIDKSMIIHVLNRVEYRFTDRNERTMDNFEILTSGDFKKLETCKGRCAGRFAYQVGIISVLGTYNQRGKDAVSTPKRV